jgi:molybdenum cofactor sulfurtransferase
MTLSSLHPHVPDLNAIERRLEHWIKVEQHQDAQSLQEADSAFRAMYPEYGTTDAIDELRAREYSRLDRLGHVYLDYTGGNLYAEAQLRTHMALLSENVYGNPHSSNPTSLAMTHLVEHARSFVLEYFNAAPDEYTVIFTSNASGALKLVGESYPFAPGGQYLLTFDNHNSVNGIREFARSKGATYSYAPVRPPDLFIDEAKLEALLDTARPDADQLFAYPAQSNFSGVQHSLEWIDRARAKGWDVLVDCAAFTPTNRLDLSQWKPDFVSLSFYKIFGYPTGIGALIARRTALAKLKRPWFAGGTITIASVQGDGHYLAEGEAGFEDGTVNYLNVPAVEIGLRHIQNVGIDTIHNRVACLTGWLLDDLTALRHSNGAQMITVYGPVDTTSRGGTVTINFFDPQGTLIDYRLIEQRANEVNISLRTGCFCNPGADEMAHGLTAEDLQQCFVGEERMTFEQFMLAMDGKSAGAVRVSLGIASNFADVYTFSRFARGFLDRLAAEV